MTCPNPKAVREWAWSRGIKLSWTGPIPKAVVSSYEKAHASGGEQS